MAFAHLVRGTEQDVAAELQAVIEVTGARLQELLEAERARRAALDERATEPIDALAEVVLGAGKRLRPAFCHWGHRAVTGGGAATDAVVDVGAALELLHAFALVHDDIMDESPTRRGRPTTHVARAEEHTRSGWQGDAARYGENVAILVGDLGHTYARRLLRDVPAPVHDLWDELEIELVVGQYLDVAGTAARDVPLGRALRIAELKSARYTVMQPLALGAALAGCDPVPEPLLEYGTAIGLAFQLRDDVLGAFGSTEVTGKPAGDDLREGKPTPLVAIALERATPAQRAVLDTIGDPDLDVDLVLSVLTDSGALDQVEGEIDRLTDQGISALGDPDADLHPPTAQLLASVAESLCGRVA